MTRSLSLIAAISFLLTGISMAQTPAEQIRALKEKVMPALVVVNVQTKLNVQTTGSALPPKDEPRQTLGVTIKDNGLIVVSNSAIDPSVGLAGQEVLYEGKETQISSAVTTFGDVIISYGDTTVLKGKIVSQDAGADVAFILPDAEEAKTKAKSFVKVDLSNYAAEADAGDEAVGFFRASSVYGFMPLVARGYVQGVFKSDRTFYVTTANNNAGAPIFTTDGKVIGITVIRVIEGQPTGILSTLSAASIETISNLVE